MKLGQSKGKPELLWGTEPVKYEDTGQFYFPTQWTQGP